MNPPLRFFVWNERNNSLSRPEEVISFGYAGGYGDDLVFFCSSDQDRIPGHVVASHYGQSTGMKDGNDQELFAGSVVVYIHDTIDSGIGDVAVVKFEQGEFVFVTKDSKSSLYNPERVVMVGHQWMSKPELKQRIAQFKNTYQVDHQGQSKTIAEVVAWQKAGVQACK